MNLTAKEARVLAGIDDIQEEVDRVITLIEAAAKEKRREIQLHTPELWVYGGYNDRADYKEACKRLANLGYKVEFIYEERQFVNMFTKVSW